MESGECTGAWKRLHVLEGRSRKDRSSNSAVGNKGESVGLGGSQHGKVGAGTGS